MPLPGRLALLQVLRPNAQRHRPPDVAFCPHGHIFGNFERDAFGQLQRDAPVLFQLGVIKEVHRRTADEPGHKLVGRISIQVVGSTELLNHACMLKSFAGSPAAGGAPLCILLQSPSTALFGSSGLTWTPSSLESATPCFCPRSVSPTDWTFQVAFVVHHMPGELSGFLLGPQPGNAPVGGTGKRGELFMSSPWFTCRPAQSNRRAASCSSQSPARSC